MHNNSSHEIRARIHQLEHLMHRHHPGPGPRRFTDISHGQGRVLAALKMQSGISTKDLAYVLGVRTPSLNEVLGRLEAKGFITRTPSPTDGRVTLIGLTDAGRDATNVDPCPDDVLDVLSAEEKGTFIEICDKLIEALSDQLDNDEEFTQWARDARARWGDERFEMFMAVGRGRHGGHGFGGPHGRGRRNQRRGESFDEQAPEFWDAPRMGRPHKW